MMRYGMRVLGLVLAVAATVAVAAFGRLPTTLNSDEDALVRLSWRLRGSQAEQTCRRPTPEELAELPEHMRNPDGCVGRVAPYRLEVTLNGETVTEETIRGAGARQDRPIYVFRELRVEPGSHEIRVSFHQEEESDEEGLALELHRTLELGPRQVALITYEADRRELVVRRETP